MLRVHATPPVFAVSRVSYVILQGEAEILLAITEGAIIRPLPRQSLLLYPLRGAQGIWWHSLRYKVFEQANLPHCLDYVRDLSTNSWACWKTGKPEGCHQIVTFLPPESHLALFMIKRNSRPMTGPSYRFSPLDIVLFFISGSVSCRPFFVAACPLSRSQHHE